MSKTDWGGVINELVSRLLLNIVIWGFMLVPIIGIIYILKTPDEILELTYSKNFLQKLRIILGTLSVFNITLLMYIVTSESTLDEVIQDFINYIKNKFNNLKERHKIED